MNRQQSFLKSLDNTQRVWHLRRTPLLLGLSPEDVTGIAQHLTDRIFPEAAPIYAQGEPATCLFFLNRGSVRLSLKADENREKTVEILKGGDVFGLEAIAEGGVYGAQAVAHEESWTSVLTREGFLGLAERRPRLSYNLVQVLLKQLAGAREDIRALCFLDTQQRLIKALLRLSRTHGHRMAHQENFVRLQVRMSHDYLARLTNANRPYLSNIMSDLKKRGWISYQRKRLLIDVEALSGWLADRTHDQREERLQRASGQS